MRLPKVTRFSRQRVPDQAWLQRPRVRYSRRRAAVACRGAVDDAGRGRAAYLSDATRLAEGGWGLCEVAGGITYEWAT